MTSNSEVLLMTLEGMPFLLFPVKSDLLIYAYLSHTFYATLKGFMKHII